MSIPSPLFFLNISLTWCFFFVCFFFLVEKNRKRNEKKLQIRRELAKKLVAVKSLNLNNCKLQKVPPAVWLITSLEFLDLGNNYLNYISDQISYLCNLQELDLSNNSKIDYLPASLGFLNEPHSNPLKRLRLAGCSLANIPESVKWEFISSNSSTLTAYHVIPFLRFLREDSAFKTLKLMFLGQEGVGKTSLIRTLTGFDFGTLGPTGDTLSTEGIDICEWKTNNLTFSFFSFAILKSAFFSSFTPLFFFVLAAMISTTGKREFGYFIRSFFRVASIRSLVNPSTSACVPTRSVGVLSRSVVMIWIFFNQ